MGEQLAPRDHVSQEIAPSGGATPASGLWLCVSSLRPQRYRQVGQVLGRLAANRELFAIQVLNDAVERRIVDSDCWRNVAAGRCGTGEGANPSRRIGDKTGRARGFLAFITPT